jgi:hypothetical protein
VTITVDVQTIMVCSWVCAMLATSNCRMQEVGRCHREMLWGEFGYIQPTRSKHGNLHPCLRRMLTKDPGLFPYMIFRSDNHYLLTDIPHMQHTGC